jgi:hypothetical protein
MPRWKKDERITGVVGKIVLNRRPVSYPALRKFLTGDSGLRDILGAVHATLRHTKGDMLCGF